MSAGLEFELDVIAESATSSPCDGCHAGCCRAFAVPLTFADIVHIIRSEPVTFWDFVMRWADPDGAISGGQVPHFYFDDDPATPFVIGLKHTESTAFEGTTRCGFLTETLAADGTVTSSCGIYESRPMACRIFPATMRDTGEPGIGEIPEYGRSEQSDAYRLCATEWSVDDLGPEVCQQIDECRGDMQLMRVLADRWNDSPRPWQLFPEFLQAILENSHKLKDTCGSC